MTVLETRERERVGNDELLAPNRLRWGCRRGMLELDILFGNFVDKSYFDLLSEDEKFIFQGLLLESDQDLHDFFMSGVKPESEAVANVIEKIRIAAAS